MTKQFISQPIEPSEPSGTDLPHAFRWGDRTLQVADVCKTWRGTKEDRGDVYLKRHWYEFETPDKQLVTVYFDRGAKPGGARWWLYAIVSREERARAIAAEIRAAGNYRWVGVYDVLSDTVSIIAYDGAAEPSYPVFPRDKGLTGQMLRAGQTLVVGDVTKNDAYLTAFGTTRSEIIVPVRVNGEIAGTLDVESERIDAFGDDDRAKLERAAEMLAPLYGARR